MNPNDPPKWLLSVEHGVLGEARARALLLERFWVLERCVDVDGADLLIQRRYLLDRKPQILGRIQAKFIQDEHTQVRIRRRDVVDEAGTAQDYFLLIFTGFGTGSKSFLISANEIVSTFHSCETDPEFNYLSGRQILKSDRFEILDVDRSLTRIEDALKRADFLRNRRFILGSQYPEVEIDPAHIDEDYEIPLHTWYGDLREEFFNTKQRIKNAIFEMTDAIEQLRGFVESTDPIEAWAQIEQFMHRHETKSGAIRFDWNLVNEEFIDEAVKRRRTLDKIRQLKVETTYLQLPAKVQQFVIDDFAAHLPLGNEQFYVLRIWMDRSTLLIKQLMGKVHDADPRDKPGSHWAEIKELSDHSVQVSFPQLFRPAELQKFTEATLEEKEKTLRSRAWLFSREFMDWIDENVLNVYEGWK